MPRMRKSRARVGEPEHEPSGEHLPRPVDNDKQPPEHAAHEPDAVESQRSRRASGSSVAFVLVLAAAAIALSQGTSSSAAAGAAAPQRRDEQYSTPASAARP